MFFYCFFSFSFSEITNETAFSQLNSTDDLNDSDSFLDFDDYIYYAPFKNTTTGELICGGNATISGKLCVCLPGYVGNPQYESNCYKCPDQCSEYGYCISPGICECFTGYEGNGTYCYLSVPTINSMMRVNNTLVVSITYKSDSSISHGYCKFGPNIVNATLATNLQFICPIPADIKSQTVFQISIDQEKWTMDNLIYEDQSNNQIPQVMNQKITIVVFIVAMVLLSLLLANSRPVQIDETQPFIKEIPRKRNIV